MVCKSEAAETIVGMADKMQCRVKRSIKTACEQSTTQVATMVFSQRRGETVFTIQLEYAFAGRFENVNVYLNRWYISHRYITKNHLFFEDEDRKKGDYFSFE